MSAEETEEENLEEINRLVLDLSLVTALPVGTKEKSYTQAAAAATALANRVSVLDKTKLRQFEWTVKPLLELLVQDIENTVAVKAALALQALMQSRICMAQLIEAEGLHCISKVLDILLTKRIADISSPTTIRASVENLAICYREVARYYPWEIVKCGGLRHCVTLLKSGDVALKTIS